MKINQSRVNELNTQANNSAKTEKPKQEQKPQAKEHCSSAASKALRGMALGLVLAAGITGAKAMPARAAEQTSSEPIAVTQEAEATAPTTEAEKVVDDMMTKENSSITLHVGEQGPCSGVMRHSGLLNKDGRGYDTAKITKDGQLIMYREDTYYNSDGSTYTSHTPKNKFDLNASGDKWKIDIQTGARYDEAEAKKGDYVELSEDGSQFIVYNQDGKEIGKIDTTTPDEHKVQIAISGAVLGGLAIAKGVGIAIDHHKNKL